MSTEHKAVTISEIERQLARLWEDAAAAGGAGPVARTVVVNIAAFCCTQRRTREVAGLIGAVAGEHPSRAIIVSYQGGEHGREEGLTAYASVACQLVSRRDRRQCTEQIVIDAPGVPMESIIGTVQPLALPDIPLALWVADAEPPASASFERLVRAADSVIADSRLTREPQGMLAWLRRISQPPGPAAVDLAWLALEPQRASVAALFDHPAAQQEVPRIRRVVVRAVAGARGQPGAGQMLMAGWAADRLGWAGLALSLDEGSRTAWTDAEGRVLEMAYDSDGQAGAVESLEFISDGLRLAAEFPPEGPAVLAAEGEEVFRLAAPLTVYDDAQLLCGALEVTRTDPLCSRAVERVLALCEES